MAVNCLRVVPDDVHRHGGRDPRILEQARGGVTKRVERDLTHGATLRAAGSGFLVAALPSRRWQVKPIRIDFTRFFAAQIRPHRLFRLRLEC